MDPDADEILRRALDDMRRRLGRRLDDLAGAAAVPKAGAALDINEVRTQLARIDPSLKKSRFWREAAGNLLRGVVAVLVGQVVREITNPFRAPGSGIIGAAGRGLDAALDAKDHAWRVLTRTTEFSPEALGQEFVPPPPRRYGTLSDDELSFESMSRYGDDRDS